jgi:hypothetical protein
VDPANARAPDHLDVKGANRRAVVGTD